MTFRVVRQSKFRHVFAEPYKKEVGYDGLRLTRNAWDSPFCSVNPKFLAVALESQGGGQFQVIPIDKVGRIDLNFPTITGHEAPVLDIAFCPLNDHLLATAAEDCMVKVWDVPEGGYKENTNQATVVLKGHQRRVGLLEWHPTCDQLLASAGFDYVIFIWDVTKGTAVRELQLHNDTIYSLSWNRDGSLLATTCKDKMVRVIDPRAGKIVQEGKGHDGAKASRVVFTTPGRLFTTGSSKMSERQYAIWDQADLSNPLRVEMIDTASGVLFPYFDEDTSMIYLVGKGDGNIRYYELTDEAPYCHYLSEFKSSLPQRGVALMPKRGCSVGDCEIARMYKLHPKGFVEVIGFTVPRKSTLFQEDIFPPTKHHVSIITAAEWLGGANRDPKTISLKEGYKPSAKAEFQAPTTPITPVGGDADDQPPKGEKELLKAWHDQRKTIKDLKAQLASAEIKIRSLSK